MQAFFSNAILCDFNTLFVVEINDSFSDIQQSLMISFIDKLLKDKMEKKGIESKSTKDYLDPCIVFIYNSKKCNSSFVKEIEKFEPEILTQIQRARTQKESESSNTSNSILMTCQTETVKILYDIN